MGVVSKILSEVQEMKLRGHYREAEVSSDHIRIMELLERQATIIEILGELNPECLKRFVVEPYNP